MSTKIVNVMEVIVDILQDSNVSMTIAFQNNQFTILLVDNETKESVEWKSE